MTKKNANSQTEKQPRRSRGRHRTVSIAYGDWKADIDIAIAPLILEMWRAGIETYLSCQGSPPGWIWIMFGDVDALRCFLNIVGRFEPSRRSLHHRMRRGYDLPEGALPGRWWYRMVVDDSTTLVAEDDEEDCWTEPELPDWQIRFCLHFPRKDLSMVLQRLIEHNRICAPNST